jgi:hypothetical protein
LALPELKGHGTVTGLRIAMTNKAALLTDVTAFKNLAATTDWTALKGSAQGILFKWAGVEGVTAISMGGGLFDRQKLAFLEAYMVCFRTILRQRSITRGTNGVALCGGEA